MKFRPLFKKPTLWLASMGLVALVVACSSSSTPSGGGSESCSGNDVVACTCSNGQTGTGKCNDPASCSCNTEDAGTTTPVTSDDSGTVHNGDGGHVDDGATPATLYSACAKAGSFGATCTSPNANDPTECTDPKFPYCFGGGQGYWCTAPCGDDAGGFAACTVEEPDGGFPDAAGNPNQGCNPSACNAKGYCK
jgi:hypothetical protein